MMSMIMEEKAVDVQTAFATIKNSHGDGLADLDSPLKMTLGALVLAEDVFGIQYLSIEEIYDGLEAAGVGIQRKQISNAISRAGSKVSRRKIDGRIKYRAMKQGRREVEEELLPSGVQVSFVESGRPRYARQRLGDLLGGLQGVVRICDPYYGVRTLDSLELIPSKISIRFLTFQSGKEDPLKLEAAIKDFLHERPNVELRKLGPPLTLHDRYIVDDMGIKIIGHGLKDIGGKDSFILALPKDLVEDLVSDLCVNFDAKWLSAT